MPITNSASGVKAGTIADFAGATAPAGWLVADGSAISRSTYAGLFNYIGTTHGVGDGSTTFNIPDCRGEFRRGLDNGRGIDTGRKLGTAQANQNASHQHFVVNLDSGPSAYPNPLVTAANTVTAKDASGGYELYILSGSATAANAGLSSLSGGTETRPRNKAYLTCIKY